MLIEFDGVDFSYGDNLILSGVGFALNEGERVALIGENGAGKTTLIKLLCGGLVPEKGQVIRKAGIKVGYLEQNGGYDSESSVYAEMRKVFAEELSAVERLEALSGQLSLCEYGSGEYANLSSKIAALERYVASHECYSVDVKIKTVLGGMGFSQFYDRKISVMSGGEKTRLKLARLLLEEPDLLVLDEPTNHLDVKTLFWLESYLSAFKGAVFVVSHDRYFLDKLSTRTLELENKKLLSFKGNYTKYKQLKAERNALLYKQYEKACEEIKRLQTYVDKNIVRATTAKSAQSRVKQIEKMELPEKPYVPPRPPRFRFEYTERPAERVLDIVNLNLEIGGKRLISAGELHLLRGKRLAITGDNGAGKSTLLKAIVGGDAAISVGRFVRFAYYDQENALLDSESRVLDEMWGRHVAYTQTEVRAALARCGLVPEDMDKKVKELSGGERAKLALCVFENERGNVLVLDEPTNHLDLPARESLEAALSAFDGTVIFVSHDRYFISALADCIAEIENCSLNYYEGGYESYKESKEKQARARAEEEELKKREEYPEKKNKSFRSAKERAAEAKKKADLKSVEADISRYECEEAQLNGSLSDPAVSADYEKLNKVLDRLDAVKNILEELYARYGELID